MVLLPETDLDGAIATAEKLRFGIAASSKGWTQRVPGITVSVGVVHSRYDSPSFDEAVVLDRGGQVHVPGKARRPKLHAIRHHLASCPGSDTHKSSPFPFRRLELKNARFFTIILIELVAILRKFRVRRYGQSYRNDYVGRRHRRQRCERCKPRKGRRLSLSKIFIARQPIFDLQQKVYGYELLFRSGLDNVFKHADPDQASAKVMTDGTLRPQHGGHQRRQARLHQRHARHPAQGLSSSFCPGHLTAAEILETIEPDPEVVGACSRLKKAGYLTRPGRLRLQRAVRRPHEPGGHRQSGFPVHAAGGAPAGPVAVQGAPRPFPGRESRDARSLPSRRSTWDTVIFRGTSSASR